MPGLDLSTAIGRTREQVVSWAERDVLLYAVAVGAGQDDPEAELELTTENSAGVQLQVLPTFPVLLRVPPNLLLSDTDKLLAADETIGMVAAEQGVELSRPFPTSGSARVTATVTAIHPKGTGVLIESESRVCDEDSSELLATLRHGIFARGVGAEGGDTRAARGEQWTLPDRAADEMVRFKTRPNQALLYRLTGDRYRLHADPAFARRAGFDRPILHGLCTYGFAARALLRLVCDGDAARFGSIHCRFSRPVYPGSTLEIRVWERDGGAQFQTTVGDEVVLDRGVFRTH